MSRSRTRRNGSPDLFRLRSGAGSLNFVVVLALLLSLLVQFLAGSSLVSAASFTTGNLVVLRVGDGTGALSSASAAVFLDEFTAGGGTVQSLPLPTAASGNNRALTMA